VRRNWSVFSPPGLTYLLREAIGTPGVDARFVYVTDGGHYDNLGLVELLDKKCGWIWCIDASGDHTNTFNTLGEAFALAWRKGITIDLDPSQMLQPKPDDESYVAEPYCVGTITYADGSTGTLAVIKAGVWAEAPWAIRAFEIANPKFPCDPTSNQLFTAEQFDAYVELGEASTCRALAKLGVQWQSFRATPTPGPPAGA
jgi:hypothetical protein